MQRHKPAVDTYKGCSTMRVSWIACKMANLVAGQTSRACLFVLAYIIHNGIRHCELQRALLVTTKRNETKQSNRH